MRRHLHEPLGSSRCLDGVTEGDRLLKSVPANKADEEDGQAVIAEEMKHATPRGRGVQGSPVR